MNYTPKPWEALDCTRHDDTRCRTQFVSRGRTVLWLEHENTVEGQANADLALASPSLLEDMQDVLRRCPDGALPDLERYTITVTGQSINQWRKTIAEA